MNAERRTTGGRCRKAGDAWLWQRARLTPAAPALHMQGRERNPSACDERCALDYAQLVREAEATALRLLSLGVGRGDRVATAMAAGPRLVALVHATQKVGAVLVPLNTRLSAGELAVLLEHASPHLLLHDTALRCPDVPAGPAAGSIRLNADEDFDRVAVAKSAALPARIDAQAPWMVVYTSGTTALPKGVVLTNANHFAAAAASRRRLGHGGGDVWLATLPLHHVGGLAILARAALEGSRVDLENGFDVERVRSAIEDGPATMISLVPTMLARVLEALRRPPHPNLRCVLVGGAALWPTLAQRALAARLPISATYGLSEACSQLCTTRPGSAEAATGKVGRPLPGVEVRIDRAGHDGVGELCARGANLSNGYFRNAEADDAAFAGAPRAAAAGGACTTRPERAGDARGRWLRTGDLASIDARGRVTIACRRSDLIISGGENVVPAQVEAVLDEHPWVNESAVFGLDDAEWGQRVVALVVPRVPDELGTAGRAAELSAWCRARLAAYKTPRELRFVGALPRNAGGKVNRRALTATWSAATR